MGSRRSFGEYPFLAVAGLVGALTVGLVVLGVELGWGNYSYALVVIPIGIAVTYLVSSSRIAPAEPPAPAPTPASAPPEEPFDDPVEEADRIARGEGPSPPPPE